MLWIIFNWQLATLNICLAQAAAPLSRVPAIKNIKTSAWPCGNLSYNLQINLIVCGRGSTTRQAAADKKDLEIKPFKNDTEQEASKVKGFQINRELKSV